MFTQLSGSSGNVLGFKIGEDTTDEEVRDMDTIMSATIAASGKIRLLVEVAGFRHMEPDFLLEKLKFATDHAGEIERMAVLGNRVWIKSWVMVGALSTHTEVVYFDRTDVEAAWQWVRS